jgi:hypothetical protein
VLVEKDPGTNKTTTWTLSNVFIVTDTVSSGSSSVPVQTLEFRFTSMSVSVRN